MNHPNPMQVQLSVAEFKEALPERMSKTVNQALIDQINNTLKDPYTMEIYRENILTFAGVLKEGKFSMGQYLDAVRYVGFKLMGFLNQDAYAKTFPDRYLAHVTRKTDPKDIASYITAYNKSKLVTLIYERSLIPTYVLNADKLQEAINHQFHLMKTAKSEKVQSDAATSLMVHLTPPETTKIELDVGIKDDGVITSLRDEMAKLAGTQQQLISAGLTTAHDTAQRKIIDVSTDSD